MEFSFVVNEVNFIQNQGFHENFISSMLLQPFDGLLKKIIEFFRAVNDEQREIDLAKNFPSFWEKTGFVMGQSRRIVILELNIASTLLMVDFCRFEGVNDLICGISFGGDWADFLNAKFGHELGLAWINRADQSYIEDIRILWTFPLVIVVGADNCIVIWHHFEFGDVVSRGGEVDWPASFNHGGCID